MGVYACGCTCVGVYVCGGGGCKVFTVYVCGVRAWKGAGGGKGGEFQPVVYFTKIQLHVDFGHEQSKFPSVQEQGFLTDTKAMSKPGCTCGGVYTPYTTYRS